jgi:hypothetical protein
MDETTPGVKALAFRLTGLGRPELDHQVTRAGIEVEGDR